MVESQVTTTSARDPEPVASDPDSWAARAGSTAALGVLPLVDVRKFLTSFLIHPDEGGCAAARSDPGTLFG
jgi:hypothetical protein